MEGDIVDNEVIREVEKEKTDGFIEEKCNHRFLERRVRVENKYYKVCAKCGYKEMTHGGQS